MDIPVNKVDLRQSQDIFKKYYLRYDSAAVGLDIIDDLLQEDDYDDQVKLLKELIVSHDEFFGDLIDSGEAVDLSFQDEKHLEVFPEKYDWAFDY